jgi:hypothetical protein
LAAEEADVEEAPGKEAAEVLAAAGALGSGSVFALLADARFHTKLEFPVYK